MSDKFSVTSVAGSVPYDNTASGLTADNVQDALDQLASGAGANQVTGPNTSTDKAIARFDGTTGKIIQDSKTLVQDGGGIEAQGFITRKVINDEIVIGSNNVMVTSAVAIEDGELVIEEDGELVIV